MTINFIILFGLIIIAFYFDIRKKIIPNWLTVSGVLLGLFYHTLLSGIVGLKSSILSMIIGFSLFLIIYFFGAIGAGDVKLFAAIGAITNIEFVLQASVYSIIYAGIIGLIILISRKEFIKRTSYQFPFMYGVLPGVITSYYYIVIY